VHAVHPVGERLGVSELVGEALPEEQGAAEDSRRHGDEDKTVVAVQRAASLLDELGVDAVRRDVSNEGTRDEGESCQLA
jgi:hypothetical protein